MKLKSLEKNKNEVTLSSGTIVLFSYQTPVAACLSDGGFIRTDRQWSRTTSKHINQWPDGANAKSVSQSTLDALVA